MLWEKSKSRQPYPVRRTRFAIHFTVSVLPTRASGNSARSFRKKHVVARNYDSTPTRPTILQHPTMNHSMTPRSDTVRTASETPRDGEDNHSSRASDHSGDEESHDGKDGQPPRKRQRVRLSCLECRRRKLSCDRGYPCERCK